MLALLEDRGGEATAVADTSVSASASLESGERRWGGSIAEQLAQKDGSTALGAVELELPLKLLLLLAAAPQPQKTKGGKGATHGLIGKEIAVRRNAHEDKKRPRQA